MTAFGTEEERYTAIVPRDVAQRQIAYERRHRVLFLREHHGLYLHTVGQMIGVTKERVRQMQLKAERERRYGVPPPIMKYMNDVMPELVDGMTLAHDARMRRGWMPPQPRAYEPWP